MWRYLNMFVLIGIALLIISVIGFATGDQFLTEPGQAVNIAGLPFAPQIKVDMGSLIYLGAGIIMLVNGYVSIKQAEALKANAPKQKPSSREVTSSGAETPAKQP